MRVMGSGEAALGQGGVLTKVTQLVSDEAGMQTLVPPIPMPMLKIIAIPWEDKYSNIDAKVSSNFGVKFGIGFRTKGYVHGIYQL